MTDPVRVRFAPSPTGMLHIGGARTALFNWAFARRHGGAFLLRIEDTDPERSQPRYETAILEGLAWLGLDWDEGPDVGGEHGPYRQSERSASYRAAVERLLEGDGAYHCFCEPGRIEGLRAAQREEGRAVAYDRRCREISAEEGQRRIAAGERPVVRFRVPGGSTRLVDLIRGEVTFANDDVEDWIMVRADGSPTYNLTCACDDAAMGITHVLRGEEHLTNTPKQVLLYHALGLEAPRFAHFPLMLGDDRKKLSKRTGDASLQDYRDKGFPPEAMVNFLCLQGWALDDKTEIFSVDDLVAHFDVEDVGKAGAVFDTKKLIWMAGEYIRREDAEGLADRCAPFMAAAGLVEGERIAPGGSERAWYLAAVETARERVSTYAELPGQLAYLFAADDAVELEPKAVANARRHEGFGATLADYLAWLGPRIENGVDADALRADTRAFVGERGIKLPALFQPLRCALTGKPGGPDLFEVMALLGPERTRRRIEVAAERIAATG